MIHAHRNTMLANSGYTLSYGVWVKWIFNGSSKNTIYNTRPAKSLKRLMLLN